MKKTFLMKQFVCFMFFLVFPLTTVLAVTVSSIYQAELPVSSQTEELKEQAIQDGFLQVLIKVSGDPQIAEQPAIKASLEKAAYYVQDYSYSSPTTSSSQYNLLIHYEPDDVIRLLKKANVPYWRENRPLTLVWLSVTNQQHEIEMIDESSPTLSSDLKQQGKKLGLPLIFPIMDMADLNQISVKDVFEMNLRVLKEAAKRYAPDALLIGKIEDTQSGVQSEWQFILGERLWNFKMTTQTTQETMNAIINQLSLTLAKQYVVKPTESSENWFKLEIGNITERDDLSKVMQYLRQLTPVQQVRLIQVSGDVVEMAIQIRGTREGFQKNVVIGQRLQLRPNDLQEDNKMTYEWVH